MMSLRGMTIGLLIMIGGLLAIYTFISPTFLISIGANINTVNAIQEQFQVWGLVIGIFIVVAGLVVMGKFE